MRVTGTHTGWWIARFVRSRDEASGPRSHSVSVLGATAAARSSHLQAVGSVALLADLIHDVGIRSPLLPLGIAFFGELRPGRSGITACWSFARSSSPPASLSQEPI